MNKHLKSLCMAMVCMLPAQAARAGEIQGTVVAVKGDNMTLRVESPGALRPAVGDHLSISQRPNEDGNALGIAEPWTVTDVKGDLVKVSGDGSPPGVRPWVNMAVVIAVCL